MGFFCVLIAGWLTADGKAADLFGFPGFTPPENLKISVYSENSLVPEAVWTINKVSLEHRRLGFFSVQLLPIVLVDGIRLDMANAVPQTNWLDGFRCEWAPAANHGVFEWRDFSIFFPAEKVPRLYARNVHPVTDGGRLICRLEGVTLQTGSQPIHLARAEVCAQGTAAEVVWRNSAAVMQWDLFSGQFTTNLITQGTQNEKP